MDEKNREVRTKLAYRMRVLFEEKLMADYRDTFRGELGRTQSEVLEHLYEHGPRQSSEIAEAIRVPKQHVSKIVSRLVGSGLVETRPNERDGRARTVFLTDSGRAYLDRHIEKSNQLALKRFKRLTPLEQDELVASMETLVRLLEKM